MDPCKYRRVNSQPINQNHEPKKKNYGFMIHDKSSAYIRDLKNDSYNPTDYLNFFFSCLSLFKPLAKFYPGTHTQK